MTEDPTPEASPPGDAAPVPDAPLADPEESRDGVHDRPSKAATADIEERQETQRAEEGEKGRAPEDAPSY